MMGRAPCCEKVGLKKGRWTTEEDEKLLNYIQHHGEGSWRSLPKNAGLLRCGKSCRLRWINYLRADLKRGNISKEEEEIIIRLHASFGNRWSLIAGHLPGRTDNEIKNYWNSHLSRSIHSYRKFGSDDLSPIMTIDINKLSQVHKRKRGKTSRSVMKKNKTMFYKKSEKEVQLVNVGKQMKVVPESNHVTRNPILDVREVVQDVQGSSVTWESIDEVMLESLLELGSQEEWSSNGDENVGSFLVFGEEGGGSDDNNVVEFEKFEGMEVVGSGEEVMEEGCKVWDEGEELWKWMWSDEDGRLEIEGMEINGYDDGCLESWLSDFL